MEELANTQMAKTVCFLVSNCLKRTNVRLGVIGMYSAPCLIGFLVGDYLKYVYVFLITVGICMFACKVA